jgi:hypothetical protein
MVVITTLLLTHSISINAQQPCSGKVDGLFH